MPPGFATDPYDRRVLLVSDKGDGQTYEPIHQEDGNDFEAGDPLIPAGFVGPDGKWHPGNVDADGNLVVAQAGGGGGGAVTIADGADVTQGAMADVVASSDTGTFSLVALFKRLLQKFTAQLPAALVGGRLDVNIGAAGTTLPVEVEPNAFLSLLNSTTTLLVAGGTFTGTAEDVSGYSSITVVSRSDVSSGSPGFQIQFSQDATNWDDVESVLTSGGNNTRRSFGIRAKWFRVIYNNSATLSQTFFRLQTIFHPIKAVAATPEVNGQVFVSGTLTPLVSLKVNFSSASALVIPGSSNRRIRLMAFILTSTVPNALTFKNSATLVEVISNVSIDPARPIYWNLMPNGFIFDLSSGNSLTIDQKQIPLATISGVVIYALIG